MIDALIVLYLVAMILMVAAFPVAVIVLGVLAFRRLFPGACR